ncbi:RNA polymerase [Cryphonectria parasitica EP155]|uniref:DNA-directed RNA polymerases I, II, and III subunit RPABC3 n=1 Tax=Cryphonectria parasitica (strain ATCC 38755 / EP155) TaxID=660469 RepID=A0A9P4Y6Y7_CRYP1|nr:RNA polymerase [Cryphonectria parasitica EP155]KAF3767487.1 RNA polymerase [Cryphonectria parasitica EP155]
MAESTNDAVLYEEPFVITAKDHKKYDRAARLTAISHDNLTKLELDINTELLPISPDENIEVCVASTLSLDGSVDEERGWRDVGKGGVQTLADGYDYVCHGKIYKFEDGKAAKTLKVYASFGGLLMALEGPDAKLTPLRVDSVYLLIKT